MCFVTSCRCELTPASQTVTLFLQYRMMMLLLMLLPWCCTRNIKQCRDERGWTLAVSSVHLLCNLASKGSWQMRFVPELVCDVQSWISQQLFSPSSDIEHRDKRSHALLLCCKDIFVLSLQGRSNDNCLNTQRSKCFLYSLRLELGFLESLFWTAKTKNTGMLN